MLKHGILGYPGYPMSQRRRHIFTKQIDPGNFQHWNNRCRCGRLPRCSPRAVPRALVVADEAPADDDGDTFFTKVWCGWRRVPSFGSCFFFHQSPPRHGPKIIPKGSKNSQRTSSPIRSSPQLRRVAPPGAWCLPLAFGETRGVK